MRRYGEKPYGIPYNWEFEVGYYEKKSFDSKRDDIVWGVFIDVDISYFSRHV